ncbi:MAG: iron-sulfur cluster assembly scaffold protein [Thermoplasmata archaeon]|nr:MAG: iron-sulfur cluster assembly scaffold protein [Thermoplasmata archaeon]
MSDKLDIWAREMERKIMEEIEKIYSPIVIKEWRNPSNIGKIKANAFAVVTGKCGDTMEIYLSIEDEMIKDASFLTDGCGATIACGSMLTKLVKGLSIEEAKNLDGEWLLKKLGGLPEENTHCATLAILTLKKALDNFEKNER